jgi:hypothetical protein
MKPTQASLVRTLLRKIRRGGVRTAANSNVSGLVSAIVHWLVRKIDKL